MARYILTLTYRNAADVVGANPYQNVFAYEDAADTGSAEDLIETFTLNVGAQIAACLSTNIVFTQYYAYDLDDPTDFFIAPALGTGLRTGQMLPGFAGYAFRFVRTTRLINDGRKTFAGISETDQDNGAAVGTVVTDLLSLASAMETIIVGAGASYTPRIFRRAGDYAPYSGDPPVGTPYPDTFYPISAVEYVRISTQNSRKR